MKDEQLTALLNVDPTRWNEEACIEAQKWLLHLSHEIDGLQEGLKAIACSDRIKFDKCGAVGYAAGVLDEHRFCAGIAKKYLGIEVED